MTKLSQMAIGAEFQLYSRYRNDARYRNQRRPRLSVKVVTREAEHITLRNGIITKFAADADGNRFQHTLGGSDGVQLNEHLPRRGVTVSISRPRQTQQAELLGKTLRVVEQGRGYTVVETTTGLRVPLCNTLLIRMERQQRRA